MNRPENVLLFSGGPLYKEVKRRLTESLGTGEWKPGEAIPAEPRLAQRFGVSVMRVAETLRSVAAPTDIAGLLELPPDAPLLLVRRVAFTLDDRPVEYRLSWVNTARHEYRRDAGS